MSEIETWGFGVLLASREK
ncbi:hypothetical protein OIU74_013926 [Salix koriyanagi]|uniref:Uncharacterized protein n=1 Tax=Salix koriyanagi TaxID=2511006 RepID=A0A9Q0SYG1_9ROSI|nr:hypothetical protein OIU74_013926 [Salix koriyanagi]